MPPHVMAVLIAESFTRRTEKFMRGIKVLMPEAQASPRHLQAHMLERPAGSSGFRERRHGAAITCDPGLCARATRMVETPNVESTARADDATIRRS